MHHPSIALKVSTTYFLATYIIPPSCLRPLLFSHRCRDPWMMTNPNIQEAIIISWQHKILALDLLIKAGRANMYSSMQMQIKQHSTKLMLQKTGFFTTSPQTRTDKMNQTYREQHEKQGTTKTPTGWWPSFLLTRSNGILLFNTTKQFSSICANKGQLYETITHT